MVEKYIKLALYTFYVAVVKLKEKRELDRLVANLNLRLGKKIPQQDVLDACIKLATDHLDDLEAYFSSTPSLTKARMKEILEMAEDFEYSTSGDIDQDIYGEK
ncbi:MAG: hypothetical protein EU536_00765 [Promethearchaeota archaeon]|nr:MAG: hypothetical protein EU536_00765 [Candidatus Lokiarchaeota archaeon]